MPDSGVLTILFTDLVSSTERSQGLGDEGADELRRAHFAVLREAIQAHGGEEVKSLGDGVMAVYPSPSQALTSAVLMQQAVERAVRRGDPVGLRIGLHTGEVTLEDGDYFGTPVVVASRLCERAAEGQILASDVLRTLAGTRGAHAYTDLGSLELKGIADPVQTLEVTWEPLTAPVVPIPSALSPTNAAPYVGREQERDTIRHAVKRTRAGERELVFLVGEPGIGKSRLCVEVAREAHDEGVITLYGRCDEEAVLPYQPFVEAFGHYVHTCPPEQLRDTLSSVGRELVRLVPDLPQRLPDVGAAPTTSDPDADRLRLFEAVVVALERAASESPVLLVLDDLHWADRPTLQLLRHLLRAEPFGICLLATYRETDLDRAHPLSSALADLRREHHFERLYLRGLDAEEIVLALERGAGHEIGERGRALSEALLEVTDGNPFFIQQVLSHLTETGRIFQRDGAWTFDVDVAELGIPEGVKEVIGRRLSAFSDEVNRILGVASVIGRDFALDILERVAEVGADELVDTLDHMVALGIVEEVGGRAGLFRFTHALVRETLYEELTATRRVLLHRRAATVFEELAGDDEDAYVAELAHHLLEAAQVAEVDRAIDLAQRAAKRAVDLLAYEAGARLYERAVSAFELKEAPDDELRCGLLLGWADAHQRMGDFPGAQETSLEAAELARALRSPVHLARAALTYAGPPESGGLSRDPQLVPLIEEATASLDEHERDLAVRLKARMATALLPWPEEWERAAGIVEGALADARALGDPSTLSFALRAGFVINFQPSISDEELERSNEIIALAEQSDDRELEYYGRGWLIIFQLMRGALDAVESELARMDEIVHKLKLGGGWTWHMWIRAALAIQSGELERGEALATAAFERLDNDAQRNLFGVDLFMLRWHQGRLEEIEPVIRNLIAAVAAPTAVSWRYSLSFLLAETGRPQEARQELDDLGLDRLDDTFSGARLFAIMRSALTCAAIGDAGKANDLYERLRSYERFNLVLGPAISSGGAAARYLGLLAATMSRWDDAERHFADAIALNERMGARPFVAGTQHDYARMLLRRGGPGDRDRADELLDHALATAREIGMKGLEAKSDALKAEA